MYLYIYWYTFIFFIFNNDTKWIMKNLIVRYSLSVIIKNKETYQ